MGRKIKQVYERATVCEYVRCASELAQHAASGAKRGVCGPSTVMGDLNIFSASGDFRPGARCTRDPSSHRRHRSALEAPRVPLARRGVCAGAPPPHIGHGMTKARLLRWSAFG
eukprot:scaffold80120_cov37-Tisochrysis_lutea.AAC.1